MHNNAGTEQRFVTSITCKNAWRKLGLTLNRTLPRLRLTSGATFFLHRGLDSLRSYMRAGGGHFEHTLRNYCLFVLYASSEHLV